MFRKYTAVDGTLKNNIHAIDTILLSPIKDKLMGLGNITALEMMYHLFRAYRPINEINSEYKSVQMMEVYHPSEPLARLIEHIERGR